MGKIQRKGMLKYGGDFHVEKSRTRLPKVTQLSLEKFQGTCSPS